MGQLTPPFAAPVYIDANALIYRVEHVEPYLTASAPLWDELDKGTTRIATSELTLFEVLVKPLRDGNAKLAHLFRDVLLNTNGLSTLPITRSILETAAGLRARHGLRTPDAIHAATALSAGCASFVTNDAAFRIVPGLHVIVLSEVVTS
jgi:predicted nucleic acid-binding protein